MEFTHKFVDMKENVPGSEMLKIKPDRVFYKIDDFTITHDTTVVNDIKAPVKKLKDLYGKTLPKYIKDMSEYISDDIPVVTQEEYLREIKDILVDGSGIPFKRCSVYLNNDVKIDSVIVLNKYEDHHILINELYQGGKFIQAMEYNLDKILEEYNNL